FASASSLTEARVQLTSSFHYVHVILAVLRKRLRNTQKSLGCMRKLRGLPIHDAQLSFELKFRNRNTHELCPQLFLHGDARQQSHAVSHADKFLDRFNRGQLDIHVERSL